MGEREVALTLERLGGMRFRQKAAAFRRRLAAGEGVEQVLWAGMLEALAYGGEREAFRRLADDVPWEEMRAELSSVEARSRAAAALARLSAAYVPEDSRGGIRPGNSSRRRLEGAAALAARFAGPGLAAALIGPLAEPESATGVISQR